jgi:hypothetical protein
LNRVDQTCFGLCPDVVVLLLLELEFGWPLVVLKVCGWFSGSSVLTILFSRVGEHSRHERDEITRNNYNDVVGARQVSVAEQASGKVHSASLRGPDRRCYESLEGVTDEVKNNQHHSIPASFECRKQINGVSCVFGRTNDLPVLRGDDFTIWLSTSHLRIGSTTCSLRSLSLYWTFINVSTMRYSGKYRLCRFILTEIHKYDPHSSLAPIVGLHSMSFCDSNDTIL